MSDPAHPLLELFAAHNVPYHLFEHPAYFTVEDGREERAKMIGAHTKNLFVKDKKSRLVLISALESTLIDLKNLHKTLGMQGRLSFASAEKMQEVLRLSPGSVTPYGLIHANPDDIQFVLDKALLDHEILNFHPLRNTATVAVARNDFLTFMEKIGFSPRIETLSASPDAGTVEA